MHIDLSVEAKKIIFMPSEARLENFFEHNNQKILKIAW